MNKENWQKIIKTLIIFLLVNNIVIGASWAQQYVSIIQIVDHPSLNQVRDTCINYLYTKYNPQELRITTDSAQGNISLVSQIAKKRISENPDVIVAISTPAAQTIKNGDHNKKIPLIFSAVADPISANLIENSNSPEGYVTGVTDNQPLEEQASLIRDVIPSIKKIGFLYNSGEINSSKIIIRMRKLLADIKHIDAIVTNSSMIKTSIERLAAEKVDAIYVPLDNTVVSAFNSVVKVANKYKIPIFTADPDLVKQGALASIGNNYGDVGLLTGELVSKVLEGEPVRDIPVRSPDTPKLYLNKKEASIIGINFSQSLLKECINCN